MRSTKTPKTKTPTKPETQGPDATSPAENQPPVAGGKAAKSGKSSRDGLRIVSTAFPSRIARKLRLLSSISGEPMASIVVSAVSRVIAKRLPDALAEISKADADDSGE